MSWERYEQRKAAWVQAHPDATSEEYEAAARREFRGDKSRRASSTERKAGSPTRPAQAHLSGIGEVHGR